MHNKRIQSDRSTRYASETAADARRYVLCPKIKGTVLEYESEAQSCQVY
jgi:hypothetical protein